MAQPWLSRPQLFPNPVSVVYAFIPSVFPHSLLALPAPSCSYQLHVLSRDEVCHLLLVGPAWYPFARSTFSSETIARFIACRPLFSGLRYFSLGGRTSGFHLTFVLHGARQPEDSMRDESGQGLHWPRMVETPKPSTARVTIPKHDLHCLCVTILFGRYSCSRGLSHTSCSAS